MNAKPQATASGPFNQRADQISSLAACSANATRQALRSAPTRHDTHMGVIVAKHGFVGDQDDVAGEG